MASATFPHWFRISVSPFYSPLQRHKQGLVLLFVIVVLPSRLGGTSLPSTSRPIGPLARCSCYTFLNERPPKFTPSNNRWFSLLAQQHLRTIHPASLLFISRPIKWLFTARPPSFPHPTPARSPKVSLVSFLNLQSGRKTFSPFVPWMLGSSDCDHFLSLGGFLSLISILSES